MCEMTITNLEWDPTRWSSIVAGRPIVVSHLIIPPNLFMITVESESSVESKSMTSLQFRHLLSVHVEGMPGCVPTMRLKTCCMALSVWRFWKPWNYFGPSDVALEDQQGNMCPPPCCPCQLSFHGHLLLLLFFSIHFSRLDPHGLKHNHF